MNTPVERWAPVPGHSDYEVSDSGRVRSLDRMVTDTRGRTWQAFTHKDTAKNGYAYAVGKLTPAGQDYAWKLITRYVGAHGTLALPRELRGGDAS